VKKSNSIVCSGDDWANSNTRLSLICHKFCCITALVNTRSFLATSACVRPVCYRRCFVFQNRLFPRDCSLTQAPCLIRQICLPLVHRNKSRVCGAFQTE
jgi:hypothetical protein